MNPFSLLSQRRLLFSLVGLASSFAPVVSKAQGKVEMKWAHSNASAMSIPALSPDHALIAFRDDKSLIVARTSYDSYVVMAKTSLNVKSIHYSADSRTLIVGCGPDETDADNRILYIRIIDGAVTKTLRGSSVGDPAVVSLSPNGQYLVCAAAGNKISLFRTADGALLKTYPGTGSPATAVAVSSDGQFLASATAINKVYLANIATNVMLPTPQAHAGAITTLQFSPDSTLLASGSSDKTVKLWKTADGTALPSLTGHTGAILTIAFSSDSQVIATNAAGDNTIREWNANTGGFIRGGGGTVLSAAFNPDGKSLFIVRDSSVATLDAATFAQTNPADITLGSRTPIAFSPDGLRLALESYATASGQSQSSLVAEIGSVVGGGLQFGINPDAHQYAFSNDGKFLIALVRDNSPIPKDSLQFWSSTAPQLMKTVNLESADAFAMSPDESLIAVLSGKLNQLDQYHVDLYDSNGFLLRSFATTLFRPLAFAFSPDMQKISVLGFVTDLTATTRLVTYRVSDGAELYGVNTGDSQLTTLFYTPDGSKIVSATADHITISNAADGSLIRTIQTNAQQINSIALSPDGSIVASTDSNNKLKFWRMSNGSLLREYSDNRLDSASLLFSPNGKEIAFWSISSHGIFKAPSLDSLPLFQKQQTTGAVAYWKVRDKMLSSSGTLWAGGDKNWQVVGSPDLNGDGVPDVLLQNTVTGKVHAWLINSSQTGIALDSDIFLNGQPIGSLPNWKVVATPDLNHDGADDIVFQNTVTGALYYWLAGADTSKAYVYGVGYLWAGGDTHYRVFATPDLNGDGTPDLLVQSTTTGNISRWLLNSNGTSIASMEAVYNTGLPDWNAVTAADFNGDGSVQVLFQNKTNGIINLWNLNYGVLGTYGTISYSTPRSLELKGLADLNGDGRPDALLQDRTNGSVWYLGLNGISLVSPGLIYGTGLADWNLVSTN